MLNVRNHIKVGIDALAIYTSRYALELATLAKARGIETDKYHIGLGQYMMSVPPPGEDIVTMGANAAMQALRDVQLNDIEMLLFATESGIDQSKAAGIYLHELLALPARCRVVELKQACYGGTAAIQLALSFLRDHPHKKVLVVAADNARYGLNTTGESSQGCGAAAMVLSVNPRILALESEYGIATENVMDFWRPNYSHEAFVDGKYSSKLYLLMLEKCWKQYQLQANRNLSDHAYFCYHAPVPRLVEKAHQHLLKINCEAAASDTNKKLNYALDYVRKMGNSYAASLYVGLASLLDHAEENLSGKRIGFYSYGSGCVAEYFSGIVQAGYRDALHTKYHEEILTKRTIINYDEYEKFFTFKYADDGREQDIPLYRTGKFRLTKMQQHKRIYQKSADEIRILSSVKKNLPQEHKNSIKVLAPGKMILSGEHAVVYGQPALAMAVNRYVTATVTQETVPQVLFDLSDLSHHSRLSYDALSQLKDKIKEKYYRFIRGDYSIRQVLHKPFELAQFAMSVLAESLNLTLPHGVKIQVKSDLPISCGMGSSAATIVSVMQAISNYMQLHIPQDTLFKLALDVENMQHGHSSGLDLRVAMQGGCLYMHGDEVVVRSLPELPMYLVNTGTPTTTTGQCVEKVAPYFKSIALQNEFAEVTKAMDHALQQKAWRNMYEAIRANHQLLIKIGVVPEKVQQFITEIEKLGCAAKICGSGAIAGDNAGALLVVTEDKTIISSISSRYGYHVVPISGEQKGAHAA